MNNQLYPSNYQQHPPPPPIFDGDTVVEAYVAPVFKPRCNMCDTEIEVKMRAVTKDYVPAVAYVALLLSLLIGLIIIMVTRVRHKFDMAFCDNCWKRTRNAGRFEAFALAGFVGSIIFGAYLVFQFDNGFAITILGLMGLGALIWSQLYKRKNSPRYKTVDKNHVVVSTPSGEFLFAK